MSYARTGLVRRQDQLAPVTTASAVQPLQHCTSQCSTRHGCLHEAAPTVPCPLSAVWLSLYATWSNGRQLCLPPVKRARPVLRARRSTRSATNEGAQGVLQFIESGSLVGQDVQVVAALDEAVLLMDELDGLSI